MIDDWLSYQLECTCSEFRDTQMDAKLPATDVWRQTSLQDENPTHATLLRFPYLPVNLAQLRAQKPALKEGDKLYVVQKHVWEPGIVRGVNPAHRCHFRLWVT
jgi:hypothetical protein